jgi:hypothetical protein
LVNSAGTCTMHFVRIRVVERWLHEGWSPWRIGYGTVGLIGTVVAVYGYVSHPRHPGAAWWMLAAVSVIAVWALLEMSRFRILYRRAMTAAKATQQYSSEAVAAVKARKEAETARRLRKLFGDGRVLLTEIGTDSTYPGSPVRTNMPAKIVRWEENVINALEDKPDALAVFERVPPFSTGLPSTDEAYSRLSLQMKVLRSSALKDPTLKISANKRSERRARVRGN